MEEEIVEIVREFGWYCANVHDADPPFLYTIGLMKTCNHPEFIVFGIDAENAYALVSGLVADVLRGKRYIHNGVYSVNLGDEQHRVGFRKVHPTQHPLYLGYAMGFLSSIGRIGELEAMQVFWPDSAGKFPFEAGCNVDAANLQPRIDIGLTPREIREFKRQWE